MACKLALFLTLLLLSACDSPAFSSCNISVNNICYDAPNKKNPPLTASWEMFDADTGKPLSGVWISFYWREFPDGKSTGSKCARNVIGQTDANGRFSNTAKDGSWMFTSSYFMFPGFQPLHHDRITGQSTIHDSHRFTDKNWFPAYQEQLIALGYTVEKFDTGRAYDKKFEFGQGYAQTLVHPWQPGGERVFWVSNRGAPDGRYFAPVGTQCFDKTSGQIDPDAEMVGYMPSGANPHRYLYDRGMTAYKYICNSGWDTATSVNPSAFFAPDYAREALLLRPEPIYRDQVVRQNQLAKMLPDFIFNGGPYRLFTKTERTQICDFVAPYTQGVMP